MVIKIVVPLDGSPRAEKVLPYSLVLATELHAEVLLLRVVDGVAAVNEAAQYLKQLQTALTVTALPSGALPCAVNRLVARVQNRSRPTDESPYQLHTQVTIGNPAMQISLAAQAFGARLIVMSSQGRNSLDSTSTRVLHNSNLPVILLHPNLDPKISLVQTFDLIPPNIMHKPVIVPLDGSDRAEHALTFADRVVETTGAPIELLEVLMPRDNMLTRAICYSAGYYSEAFEPDMLAKAALQYLTKIAENEKGRGQCAAMQQITSRILEAKDKAANEIINYARKRGAGLVIMTSRGRSGWSQLVRSSVSGEVVGRSGLPVLLVSSNTRTEANN